jgi:hypothetical protein
VDGSRVQSHYEYFSLDVITAYIILNFGLSEKNYLPLLYSFNLCCTDVIALSTDNLYYKLMHFIIFKKLSLYNIKNTIQI